MRQQTLPPHPVTDVKPEVPSPVIPLHLRAVCARRSRIRFRVVLMLCVWLGATCVPWGDSHAWGQMREQDEPAAEDVFDREYEELPPLPELKSLPKGENESLKWVPEEVLAEVLVEGQTTIPEAAILRVIKSRGGRMVTVTQIREDQQALYRTRWFTTVDWECRETPEGPVLLWHVVERPSVERVEYKGNKKVKTRVLEAQVGLRAGSPFSVAINKEAVRKIEQYYHEKGYPETVVELEKGGEDEDREVVFLIHEGPKTKTIALRFEGNEKVPTGWLKGNMQTKRGYGLHWYFGGKYDATDKLNDVARLTEYYESLGYFDAKIEVEEKFSEDRAYVEKTYKIHEGEQFKIRQIQVTGAEVLPEEQLRKDFEVKEGDAYNFHKISKDLKTMQDKYGELGRLYATVDPKPVFTEEPGVVDLVYEINEDRPYRIRMIQPKVNGENPHTKATVILNRMLVSPGDLANPGLLEKSRKRIAGSGLVSNTPDKPVRMNFERVDEPYRGSSELVQRGQSLGENDRETSHKTGGREPIYIPLNLERLREQTRSRKDGGANHHGAGKLPVESAIEEGSGLEEALQAPVPEEWKPRETERPSRGKNSIPAGHDGQIRSRKVSQGKPVQEGLVAANDSQGILGYETIDPEELIRGQSPAADPLNNLSPQGDPYGNPALNQMPGWIDVFPEVSETQTGKIMFGVGFNSDAGLLGNFVLDEQNFDILRPPTSFRDLINGQAWRGAGQQFRLEAVPGNQLSRYTVSWRDPYFLDTNFSLGVSGFYYQRNFEDWDETRGGGRVSVGQQFTPFLSGNVAVRLENVELDNPHVPTPPILQESLGSNLLSTVRVSMAHDTRDSTFLPSEGHYLEAAYEQAFGDFSYPRGDLEGRQYFLLRERPDGFGKHILTLRGQLSYTGDDTPIFERLFAGGYQTFRGFQFRGVSPEEMGTSIGGQWLALGSVEYMFPLLANEMLRGVVFSDFGTVENDVSFDDFRATIGTGVRIALPALGPAPLALDFAFPLASEATDKERIFSFSAGLSH